MNTIERTWLTWKHARKFAKQGKGCLFPIPDLTVEGHVELGDLNRFRNNVTLRTFDDGKIIFSSRSGCSWGVTIEAHELVRIEEYTAIAEYSYVTDTQWALIGASRAPAAAQRITRPVHIGAAVFIGSGCFIGPGVTIGEGAVVATHSVVLRDIAPYEIWSGNPARLVGHRTENISESKLQEYQELIQRHGVRPDRYKS